GLVLPLHGRTVRLTPKMDSDAVRERLHIFGAVATRCADDEEATDEDLLRALALADVPLQTFVWDYSGPAAQLTWIERNMSTMRQLTDDPVPFLSTLYLSKCDIAVADEDIARLAAWRIPRLHTLQIASNWARLVERIEAFPNLRALSVSGGALEGLPP